MVLSHQPWFISFPSPSFPSTHLSSPSSEVASSNPASRLGGCCKLPQQGVGQNPSQNLIWCIVALKSAFWWQQFQEFSWYSTDHILCTLNNKCKLQTKLSTTWMPLVVMGWESITCIILHWVSSLANLEWKNMFKTKPKQNVTVHISWYLNF